MNNEALIAKSNDVAIVQPREISIIYIRRDKQPEKDFLAAQSLERTIH